MPLDPIPPEAVGFYAVIIPGKLWRSSFLFSGYKRRGRLVAQDVTAPLTESVDAFCRQLINKVIDATWGGFTDTDTIYNSACATAHLIQRQFFYVRYFDAEKKLDVVAMSAKTVRDAQSELMALPEVQEIERYMQTHQH